MIERVTFHNTENGFCVLRIKARGHRDVLTVVGHAAIISAGEWITVTGEWIVPIRLRHTPTRCRVSPLS
ncbi:YrrC family ATP-dependent DNA helicase [Roseixanthobacter psychrophilus]